MPTPPPIVPWMLRGTKASRFMSQMRSSISLHRVVVYLYYMVSLIYFRTKHVYQATQLLDR